MFNPFDALLCLQRLQQFSEVHSGLTFNPFDAGNSYNSRMFNAFDARCGCDAFSSFLKSVPPSCSAPSMSATPTEPLEAHSLRLRPTTPSATYRGLFKNDRALIDTAVTFVATKPFHFPLQLFHSRFTIVSQPTHLHDQPVFATHQPVLAYDQPGFATNQPAYMTTRLCDSENVLCVFGKGTWKGENIDNNHR